MIKKLFSSLVVSALLFMQLLSLPVRAETIELSQTGNGAGSSNEISVNVQSNTTVEQSNNANISNNVEQNLDTGNNQASDNSGDATIATGNISTTTDINNENINKNIAGSSCASDCPSGISVNVSGNGAESGNNVNVDINNNTYTNQNNSANITNNVQTNANTGYNEANRNNGDVAIVTGNIYSETNIENSGINKSYNSVSGAHNDVDVKISGNGANSENDVNISKNKSVYYFSNNIANILNEDIQDLNTGNNKASGNNGLVFVKTGDIYKKVNISNKDINVSVFKEICKVCVPEKDKPQPPGKEVKPPEVIEKVTEKVTEIIREVTGEGGVAAAVVAEEVGEVLGISGEILPITGDLTTIGLFFLGTMLFSTGLLLRVRNSKDT
jgi:hypothetical protein